MQNSFELDEKQTALFIAANPDRFVDQPTAFGDAWQFLKQARGQDCDWSRMGRKAHIIRSTPIEPANLAPASNSGDAA